MPSCCVPSRFGLVLLLGVGFPGLVRAQIVNVLPEIRAQQEDGLRGALEASLTWQQGNNPLLQTRLTAGASYVADPHAVYLIVRGGYGERDTELFLSQHFEHLRYRGRLWRSDVKEGENTLWFGGETFVQNEGDEFRRIKSRVLAGGGPRLALTWDEDLQLALGSAFMAEYQELTREDLRDTTWAYRWSNYIQAVVALTASASLSHVTFVQPRWDQFSDYRVFSETSLAVKANDVFGLKLSFRAVYDNRPPTDVETLDTVLQAALTLSL